eukprot:jgi/Mesvir1/23606/Mv18289-RA.1
MAAADGHIFPGADGMLYEYRGEQQAVERLPISVQELVEVSPALTQDGALVLGERSTVVFVLDASSGKLLRSFHGGRGRGAGDGARNEGLMAGLMAPTSGYRGGEGPAAGAASAESFLQDAGLDVGAAEDVVAGVRHNARAPLYIAREDYTVRSVEGHSGAERWNVTVARLNMIGGHGSTGLGGAGWGAGKQGRQAAAAGDDATAALLGGPLMSGLVGLPQSGDLLAGADNTLQLIDAATGREAWTMEFVSPPVAVFQGAGRGGWMRPGHRMPLGGQDEGVLAVEGPARAKRWPGGGVRRPRHDSVLVGKLHGQMYALPSEASMGMGEEEVLEGVPGGRTQGNTPGAVTVYGDVKPTRVPLVGHEEGAVAGLGDGGGGSAAHDWMCVLPSSHHAGASSNGGGPGELGRWVGGGGSGSMGGVASTSSNNSGSEGAGKGGGSIPGRSTCSTDLASLPFLISWQQSPVLMLDSQQGGQPAATGETSTSAPSSSSASSAPSSTVKDSQAGGPEKHVGDDASSAQEEVIHNASTPPPPPHPADAFPGGPEGMAAPMPDASAGEGDEELTLEDEGAAFMTGGLGSHHADEPSGMPAGVVLALALDGFNPWVVAASLLGAGAALCILLLFVWFGRRSSPHGMQELGPGRFGERGYGGRFLFHDWMADDSRGGGKGGVRPGKRKKKASGKRASSAAVGASEMAKPAATEEVAAAALGNGTTTSVPDGDAGLLAEKSVHKSSEEQLVPKASYLDQAVVDTMAAPRDGGSSSDASTQPAGSEQGGVRLAASRVTEGTRSDAARRRDDESSGGSGRGGSQDKPGASSAGNDGGKDSSGSRQRVAGGGNVITVGRLSVGPGIIGYGSHGTVVFEGVLNSSRLVAVKRMLGQFYEQAEKELDALIATDEHPNVVRCFAMEEDADFVYMALERCWMSLADLVALHRSTREVPGEATAAADPSPPPRLDLLDAAELATGPSSGGSSHGGKSNSAPVSLADLCLSEADRDAPSPLAMQLMHDITAGLAHLHALNVIHRDVKPQNVLITRHLRAKLSDMGLSKRLNDDQSSFTTMGSGGSAGWQARETLLGGRKTKAVDVFSLGCVLFYVITGGEHPFGSRWEREANVLKGAPNLLLVSHLPEAVDLLMALLEPSPERRPSAEAALVHPFFWPPDARLSFLLDVSDRVEGEDRVANSQILAALEACAPRALGHGPWDARLSKELLENLGRYRKYNNRSVRDLLRVIRNKCHHYRELPPELCAQLGTVPSGFLHYFQSRFPQLLLAMHDFVVENCKAETGFAKYFRPATGNKVYAKHES